MTCKTAALFAGLCFWASAAEARPYYAARKGLSCAACHIAPAGGGMRKPRENSPGRLTDAVSLGADLRVSFSRIEKSGVSAFEVDRSALYVAAAPRPELQLVYNMDNAITSQVYGLWRAQGNLPFYARAGRFWLPYGIQWEDPDNSVFTRTTPFTPNVGFDMSQSAADTGVEFGLAPKKDYFLNLSLTNGQPAGATDNNERKAATARAGIIRKFFMVGGSFYTDSSGPLPLHKKQTRFDLMGWLTLSPVVLMAEWGSGSDELNSGGRTRLRSSAAELDLEPGPGWLGKVRFDSVDPDTSLPGDDRRRYSIGVERLLESISVELAYRLSLETPKVKNNELFLQTHVWF